ncbi:ankyrin repeat, SAM and basic leucine zipper domain-containing protein 1 isoform X2 [Hippocampus comes]|uniref:ankyrin repeat, SAM and basic leucine zipper domain-containing protein 1 isoform X2 n=1 Tax=Hippocampus comes TaxID=109280 RepID=UPI00094E7454|nr:PREDICTED: ankyrin repeat, SAM and basic leucine zipper domain-containing protein 1 isoform X2 [Hippocampus comes]
MPLKKGQIMETRVDMDDLKDLSFAAGYESDTSSGEWFMDRPPDKKCFDIQKADNAVADTGGKVYLLKTAIREGNVAAIEQLLDDGMNVDSSLTFDHTPLMCAVSLADHDVAKVLLDRGANANFKKDGWTVLMACCTASAKEDKIARCVELLLSRNADPNMADRSQVTCLMLAARANYCTVLNLLASHGANLDMQDANGYTALSVAVHHGREKAVLKLLQLGADSSIATKAGKSPAQLALLLKHAQISRILSSTLNSDPVLPFNSTEETLPTIVKANPQPASFAESVPKLDDLELLLRGLDLDYHIDKDITWGELLTMQEEDLAKVGITEAADQQKVLSAVQQMHLDKLDLDTMEQLGVTDSGSEELLTFLLKVKRQCFGLTETIQDTVRRLPLQVSKLVFTLDHKREAQAVCSQLMVQTQDLQTEVNCLHNLLCQMNEAPNCCRLPPPVASGDRTPSPRASVAAVVLGAALLLFFSHRYLPKLRSGFMSF